MREGWSYSNRMGKPTGSATADRNRMRHDLRELAKMASPTAAPPSDHTPHNTFATADSSGFVDLSAFSATDEDWVEKELERSRRGDRAKGGAVLAAGSMAPVAMTALLAEADAAEEQKPKRRGWVSWTFTLTGVAALAALAVTIAKHPPPGVRTLLHPAAPPPAVANAAPILMSPVAPVPPPAAAAPATPDPVPAASASAPLAVTVAAPDNTPPTKKKAGARWHGSSAAASPAPASPAPARAAAATPAPAVIPKAKSGGGGSGDSLMDLMKASINSSKK